MQAQASPWGNLHDEGLRLRRMDWRHVLLSQSSRGTATFLLEDRCKRLLDKDLKHLAKVYLAAGEDLRAKGQDLPLRSQCKIAAQVALGLLECCCYDMTVIKSLAGPEIWLRQTVSLCAEL